MPTSKEKILNNRERYLCHRELTEYMRELEENSSPFVTEQELAVRLAAAAGVDPKRLGPGVMRGMYEVLDKTKSDCVKLGANSPPIAKVHTRISNLVAETELLRTELHKALARITALEDAMTK